MRGLRVVAAALALLLLTAAAPPEAVELSAEEQVDYDAGKIVVRHLDSETGGGAVAVVAIDATPRAVMDALMDLQARVDEIGALKEVDVYHHDEAMRPETVAAMFRLGVLGNKVVFHVAYVVDRDGGWATFALDPAKENDIVKSEGYYLAIPEEKGTRLVYRSAADSGRYVPQWVKRWLASDSLTQQVQGIKDRAESSGK